MVELQTTEDVSQVPGTPKPGMPHTQEWCRLQKMALDCKLPTRRDGTQKDWSINDLLKDRSYDSEHVIMVALPSSLCECSRHTVRFLELPGAVLSLSLPHVRQ